MGGHGAIQRTSKNRARKIKLEDWLIMALRCLALFLAALAMMRLVFTNEEALSSVTPRRIDSSLGRFLQHEPRPVREPFRLGQKTGR